MADDIISRDSNLITVLAGVTDDASAFIKMLPIDPTTGRLKVSISSGAGLGDMLLGTIQTVTAAKTFNDGKLILAGATSGTTVLKSAAIAGSSVVTLPSGTVTLLDTTGTAAKATILATARTIGGVSFDGSANITVSTATAGFTVSGGDLALGANNITMSGSIGVTGTRVLKGWFIDLEVTNAIAGSITGNAATVTTNANLSGVITSVGNTTSIASQTGTGTKFVVDTSPTLVTPNIGVASAVSLATSAATPLLLTNGQLVNIALTSQTVGATTLTVPDFASVVDTFAFITLAQTLSNKTFVAPALGTPASGTLTNCTGLPIAGLVASTSTAIGVGSIELGHATDTTIARVSAGIISVEGVTIPSISSTNTLTNKRITPRILSAASYTTDTGTSLNIDNLDQFIVTAQAGALLFNNPTGTPVDGQKLIIAVTGTAARALTYGNQFEASTVALPTTTVTTARLNIGFIWRADTSKWVCVASA